jgi:cytochrome P450
LEAWLLENRKIDFLVRFDRSQRYSFLRFLLPRWLWTTMRFLNVGTERTLHKDAVELSNYIQNILDDHRTSGAFETQDDLISLYYRTGKASRKTYMMEDAYLKDAIMSFMIAGRDTTSSTLTNMFKLMTPEVESKMLMELDQVVGRDDHVRWDHISKLRYSGAVFNEVIRMYPPVGTNLRTAVNDDVLPSGYHIYAGSRVLIQAISIGRDPHLWDKPDEFIPERWLPEDETKPTRRPDEYVFPVFWGGPRLCLGKDMARLEVLSIAYTILKAFKVKVLPHDPRIANGPVQFYEHGLPVVLTHRHQET